MLAVPYRRWSLTRGSNWKALTGKVLVFWIGGRLKEVVTYGGLTYIIILGLQPRDKGVNMNRIFSQRIYMKIELVPRGREMLLFLTSNIADVTLCTNQQ